MKTIIAVLLTILIINSNNAQTYSELIWTKFYEPVSNKKMGVWPHDSRYEDISRLKEFKYRWGFNHLLLSRTHSIESYNALIDIGYDSTNIFRQIRQDTYEADVESIPRVKTYYIDEPADEGDNFDYWVSITDWIEGQYPDVEFVISGYKRTDQLKEYVDEISDKVMFSSYKHWWEFLGLWISWPEDPDQRPDWADMQNRYGSKFSLSWVGAHRDIKEYDNLLGKAKNLGLDGVFHYQHEPHDDEIDDSNIEKFAEAASKHGFLITHFQQVADFYNNGEFTGRKLVGPSYPNSIPTEFDHSELLFGEYTVTNNRIEDYFAAVRISAGGTDDFLIPTGKNASFNSENEILLKPGFHSEKGSKFRAYIGND